MNRGCICARSSRSPSVGGASVAWSQGHEPQCSLRVDVPNNSNEAWLGRQNCANSIHIDAYIKEDRPVLPDITVGEAHFVGGIRWVDGSCAVGVGNFYSEVQSSSGASAQSARARNCD